MPGLPFAPRVLGKLQSILLLKWHRFGWPRYMDVPGLLHAGRMKCRLLGSPVLASQNGQLPCRMRGDIFFRF